MAAAGARVAEHKVLLAVESPAHEARDILELRRERRQRRFSLDLLFGALDILSRRALLRDDVHVHRLVGVRGW